MNYEETIHYLYDSTPVFERVGAVAYKPGLGNTLALDAHFGHPHGRYATIHVAGTNGKGSCSHTIAAILQSMGLKVGLYTSPHLIDFCERIRINGVSMSKDYVIDFVERERSFFEPLHPSFFELTTALAFKYFADENIDIAVVEVGLGGRLDCTNIITPLLSVITNISRDHTEFLGDTLAKIAYEKAGIIKKGVPVVVGESDDETRPVFEARAKEVGASIVFADDEREVVSAAAHDNGGISLNTLHYGTIDFGLGGCYQQRNANTILTAIGVLNKVLATGKTDIQCQKISQESVANGMKDVCRLTSLYGRWQVLSQKPLTICDTGHNVGGWQYLAQQIKAQRCGRRLIVFGMVDDKDIDTVMRLMPDDALYFFTQASTKRAIPVGKVIDCALRHGRRGEGFPTVPEAYHAAMAEAHDDDFIFIGGSSYVVADLLTHLHAHGEGL